jgi:hypothetical protein
MDRDMVTRQRQIDTAGLPEGGDYPYEADPDDHCESPAEAYTHVQPILNLARQKLDVVYSELSIYDPYYCAGSCKRHLKAVGFNNVRS